MLLQLQQKNKRGKKAEIWPITDRGPDQKGRELHSATLGSAMSSLMTLVKTVKSPVSQMPILYSLIKSMEI